MLNLLKLNKTKVKKRINLEEKKYSKDFPPSTREWYNSIYVFNKNALNLIPIASFSAISLIKSYFYLYNFKIEHKIRKTKIIRRFKRLSTHKIYVSNGEFKHTNNKVIIILYLFNRQRHNYTTKIEKNYLKVFRLYKEKLNNRFKLIKYKGLKSIKKANKKKYMLIKALNFRHTNKKTIKIYKSLYSRNYITKFYTKIVRKALNKLKLYLYYKQLLYINKSKFNFTYLQSLKNNLEKLYNKNVEFNLVNLKYFYLNSDILSESITLKIKKNRRKLLKFLNLLKRKVKIKNKNIFISKELNIPEKTLDLNLILNNINSETNKGIFFKDIALNSGASSLNKKISLKKKKTVLNSIKYKYVTGVRLEATGRLTKRYTASRSLSKVKYKGNLINIDSSYNGLSSVILRGNIRSNLQYTKLKSKTRIGSFGIKGWVSGS